MDKCAICGKELPPFTYRETHAKGFVCRKCSGQKDDKKPPGDGPGPAPGGKPEPKKEEKKREVPGLSEAIDGLLKE